MTLQEKIDAFFAGSPFAVVGASAARGKYGNRVLRAYLQNQRKVYAINPKEDVIEGVPCFADLLSLPEPVHGVSIITPPAITERVVEQAAQARIMHLWMQPGAESDTAIERAQAHGINCIAGGPCLLVVAGYRETV
jgi:predicted CoA-binding protein